MNRRGFIASLLVLPLIRELPPVKRYRVVNYSLCSHPTATGRHFFWATATGNGNFLAKMTDDSQA